MTLCIFKMHPGQLGSVLVYTTYTIILYTMHVHVHVCVHVYCAASYNVHVHVYVYPFTCTYMYMYRVCSTHHPSCQDWASISVLYFLSCFLACLGLIFLVFVVIDYVVLVGWVAYQLCTCTYMYIPCMYVLHMYMYYHNLPFINNLHVHTCTCTCICIMYMYLFRYVHVRTYYNIHKQLQYICVGDVL